MNQHQTVPRVDWLDPLRALALFGVLLNHLVEGFGPGPWFTNPSDDWPPFAVRMANVFPRGHGLPVSVVQFLGWLGDSTPGVFLLVSGFGLTWAALYRNQSTIHAYQFYKRRAVRLFPLYILLHILFMAGVLLIPGSSLAFADPKTLLSLLGLRFSDALFFYINPSWWFVWLIVQLYVLFPLLYHLLRELGSRKFLVLACLFTFVSRFSGLLGLRYSSSLYHWMTGIFFGTRLAEFCVGMVIATELKGIRERGSDQPRTSHVFAFSSLVYLLGLGASFTWYGSTVSNLLVALGLSGLFFSLWDALFRRSHLLSGVLTALGANSYGPYLVHQTPLQATGRVTAGTLHLVAAVTVIILSVPLGFYLNRFADFVLRQIEELRGQNDNRYLRIVAWVVSLAMMGTLFFVEPRAADSLSYRALSVLIGACLIFLTVVEATLSRSRTVAETVFSWLAITSSLLCLFVFPQDFGRMSLFIGGVVAVLSYLIFSRTGKRVLSWSVGSAATLLILIVLEISLARHAPVESGRWGEFPALQLHPSRTYALKPNLETHLRYNNYDYSVSTNSLGLNSPEVDYERPAEETVRILVIGDGFTMPEGMGYKHAYPALLEKEVSEMIDPGSVEVVNAGVTGYGPREQLPQLQEMAYLLRPDIVIYQFFINEFDEVNLTREQRLSSIGFISDAKYPWHEVLRRSQLKARLGMLLRSAEETLLRRSARWRYEKALLPFYESGDNWLYSQENLEEVGFYLGAMNNVCNSIGASFVIYFVPSAVEVSDPSHIPYLPRDLDLADVTRFDFHRPYASLRLITDALDIPAVNLRAPLKEHPTQPVYFPESWHWNQEGHRVVARYIAKDLSNRGLLTIG